MKPTPGMDLAAEVMSMHEQAADWYLRRQEHGWSSADEQAFDTWRSADARHDQLYRNLARTWQDLGEVARPQLAIDVSPAASARPRTPPPVISADWRQRLSRQWLTLGVTAGLLLAVGGWFAYDNIPGYQMEVATGQESRTLDLPDGSHIAVNMNSALQVKMYPRRREIMLARGEAFFEVAHDAGRPFTVTSGISEVRVVGTVFDVQASAPQLLVKVREGRVEVRPDKRIRENFTTLTANQGLEIDAPADAGQRFTVSADMVGDWRSGQLVFRATPLASVAATLSHYLGKPVRVEDAAVGRLAVSGYVAAAAPRVFIESLPDLIAVKVKREADGAYRISAR